ncbi:hypothetical protein GPECTOR_5g9 [Gonium pectorale]|uniref:Uncharacterized protein n=1 Tax=Gonium pectorale TaxID=33097 RepID=A0A150GX27_GONPE|nr:hypothetical protein GPECTOR_5g9 [Gonium pectorale]|eukprot:KXZ54437.1 hypothetical protein GPECTOR_5g9 [Gonium pectorale]
MDLKALFPEETWRDAHLAMIYFGREHCPAQRHDPSACPICSWAAKGARGAAAELESGAEEAEPPSSRSSPVGGCEGGGAKGRKGGRAKAAARPEARGRGVVEAKAGAEPPEPGSGDEAEGGESRDLAAVPPGRAAAAQRWGGGASQLPAAPAPAAG